VIHSADSDGIEQSWVTLGAMARVWLPDPPDSGRSWKPRRGLNVDQLGEALIAWMDAAGIAQAVLVGKSR
jgi:pimeloyl-ACP methyl ester carboxylesterase